MARSNVSPLEFVRIWESADNVREVAEATGLKPASCQVRASTYRSKGIALKHMPRGGGQKLDTAECCAFLEQLRAEQTSED